jgi:hypothetical protein
MRLSSLVVVSILLVPPALLAQHSSASSSSSGSSASHSSSSSGGASHSSSGASASHGSSSAGSHSASSHASTGSSGSATGHNSTSHKSPAGTVEARSSATPLRSGTEPSRSDVRTIREPVTDGLQTKEKELSTTKTPPPEKRSFFSFLRHPFRKPEPKPKPKPEPTPGPKPAEPELRVICKREPCAVCPPGQPGKNGACATNAMQPNIASTRCLPNESWNGAGCVNTAQCATFRSRADLLTAEARGNQADMAAACSTDPNGQECSRLSQSHDGAVQRYRMLLNEAPVNCRTLLPDPLSL